MGADHRRSAGRLCERLAALATAVALGGCVSLFAAAAPARSQGGVLVSPGGMTLYTFDRDVVSRATAPGSSACVGQCAERWPPFAADAGARRSGDFTVIERDDGTRQWAYKGRPLYRWSKDVKPGDRTGDGIDNLWRAARP
jgi:predicted lipoprotein with Yx(FWY)xxD motif